METMGIGEVSKGSKLMFDGAPWLVLEVNFVKPGKGNAFYKLRVINLLTGNTLEKTLRGGEKVEVADVEDREMQYMYHDGTSFAFMDQTTYEQVSVSAKSVGDDKDFLL